MAMTPVAGFTAMPVGLENVAAVPTPSTRPLTQEVVHPATSDTWPRKAVEVPEITCSEAPCPLSDLLVQSSASLHGITAIAPPG